MLNWRRRKKMSKLSRYKLYLEYDRTLKEIAMLKQYENERWQEQFDYWYDYDDDENYQY